jgi:hypothetical protein
MAKLLQSTREELIERYEAASAAGGNFTYRTIPYYSTGWAEAEVVNVDETNEYAYAIFRAQAIDLFDYGVGQRILVGAGERKATAADTNLAKATSTNGAFDFVIEQIAIHAKHALLKYEGITSQAVLSFIAAGQTIDADLLKALQGEGDVFDPTAIATPQQLASPFFAQNVLWSAIKNHGSLAITFDSSNYRTLGVLANFALGAEGHPPQNDSPPPEDLGTEIPEGLLWAKDGETDSDLGVRIQIHRPVIVPISTIVAPGTGRNACPLRIWLPLVVTLRGLEMGLPSSN